MQPTLQGWALAERQDQHRFPGCHQHNREKHQAMRLPAGEAYLPHDQVQVPVKVEAEILQCVGLPIPVAPLLLLEQEDQQLVADALN